MGTCMNGDGSNGDGSNIIGAMLTMKMLGSMCKDNGDLDFGKMYLLQQMSSGRPLKINDVVKTKLISALKLDGDEDMDIEKVMLLQMVEGGSIDVSQLMAVKLLGSMFKEDKKKSE